MNINQMRQAIASVYSGKGWKTKVAKMPEDQVHAVYLRFKREGKIK